MQRLLSILPFALALPILVGAALVQGKKSERWGQFPAMREAAARLENLPPVIDTWKGETQPRLNDITRRAAGAEGDIEVLYTNSKTGEKIDVFLDCGRLMDMQNHRPDRCYPAQGYHPVGGEPTVKKLQLLSGKPAEFKMAVYGNDTSATQIYWSWSSDATWLAPEDDDLRHQFTRERPVFKLYFRKTVTDPKASADDPTVPDFIRLALPEMNKALFPEYNQTGASGAPDSSKAPASIAAPAAAPAGKSAPSGTSSPAATSPAAKG